MSARSSARPIGLVLSCEHASAQVPIRYADWLALSPRTLASHRAFDAGALELARELSRALRAALVPGRQTRLLVDLNRPPQAAFGPATARWSARRKSVVLRTLHTKHWNAVRAAILAAPAPTLHLGCHSFTPILRGQRRDLDLGLLYDPARPNERDFVLRWQRLLAEQLPELRIRRNAPYRGNSPGLTTSLRAEFPPSRYLGLELECNQRLWRRSRAFQLRLRRVLAASLAELLAPD
jgi:predicted N-formylglutamate amidohydrolase